MYGNARKWEVPDQSIMISKGVFLNLALSDFSSVPMPCLCPDGDVLVLMPRSWSMIASWARIFFTLLERSMPLKALWSRAAIMPRLIVDAYDLLGRVQMFVGEVSVVTVRCKCRQR